MRSATAYPTSAAANRFRFKKRRVQVRKVLQLQARNFLADEMFDCLQRGKFLPAHERERVAHILRPACAPDTVHVIFRMLRHIVVDNMTYPRNVQSA